MKKRFLERGEGRNKSWGKKGKKDDQKALLPETAKPYQPVTAGWLYAGAPVILTRQRNDIMSVRSLWCPHPAHVVCVLADRMSRNLVVRKKKKSHG